MDTQIFFDTDKLAAQLRIPKDDYEALKKSVRSEFADDQMMYELHLLRALNALARKSSTEVTG
jgi:hypothetical protein